MTNRFIFTRARLEKLEFEHDPEQPKRDRFYVWDERQPGLALCVTSSGGKIFYVVRKIIGRVERIRLESFPAIDVDQARGLAQEQIGKIAGGQNPAEKRRVARGEQTLGELFTRYIEDHAKPHKRTWQDDQEQFDRYCTGLKTRRLSGIHRRDIQQLHTQLGAKHKYAANRLLALLSKVFAFAGSIGFEGANPCKGIQRFREHSRERFMDSDEMQRFLAALDAHSDTLVADFFRTCLFTGARRSNVQAMAWADVNFGKRIWTIPASQAKGGEQMQVYLTDPAIEVLQRRWAARIEGNLFAFPSYGATGHLTEPKAAWKQILERAKISGFRLHDLRRTFGSWLAMNGASLPIIGKALGHRSQQSTAVYSRMNLSPVAAAMEQAAALMTGTKKRTGKGRKARVSA